MRTPSLGSGGSRRRTEDDMRRRVEGVPVYRWVGTRHAALTRGWYLPRREWWFIIERLPYRLLLHWRPYHGIRLAAEGLASRWRERHTVQTQEEYAVALKKRDPMAGPRGAAPGPSPTSTLLGKLPAIREFLSATAYEDGSPRTVGNLRVASQGRLWEVTLQDPDALARLTVRDESLDRCLTLLEQLVGVEEAPWETDRWLAERAQKNGRKK